MEEKNKKEKKISNSIILKSHVNQEGKKIVAIIDEELLGKKIEEKEIQLDLNSNFFKGKKYDLKLEEKNILKEIETSYMIIAVGKKTTEYLQQKKIILKEEIKKIDNVPYIYVLARKE